MNIRHIVIWTLFLCLTYALPGIAAAVTNPLVDVSDKLDGFVRSDGSDGLGGAAWFDYNNDGSLDLYITNVKGHNNALFANNGDGTFTDVAAAAGVANGEGNGGLAAADINNDGCTDLFLGGEGSLATSTVHSPLVLYLNNCDGTFTDITASSGIIGAGSPWTAAFADINNDGFLDLFITNSTNFPLDGEERPNQLFLNNGDMTFTDISASAGIDTALGGCMVAMSDYDEDGLIDIFAGNCMAAIDAPLSPASFQLWRNNGDLTFTDVAPQAGIDAAGFWMSTNLGDIDNDGDFELFATNVGGTRPHALYENNGDGTYTDIAGTANIESDSEFSWGGGFADFDNDGFLDLIYQGNWPEEARTLFPVKNDNIGPEVGNPGRLFFNNGDNTFTLVDTLGLENRYSSGLAVGDFNNDGFSDVVIVTATTTETTQELGTPILLQNTDNGNNWVTVRLIGTVSNRDGVGALVRVKLKADRGTATRRVKQVHAGSGFLSMDSPWLTFGLGTSDRKAVRLKVKWPSGLIERFIVPTRQTVTVTEGTGKPTKRF